MEGSQKRSWKALALSSLREQPAVITDSSGEPLVELLPAETSQNELDISAELWNLVDFTERRTSQPVSICEWEPSRVSVPMRKRKCADAPGGHRAMASISDTHQGKYTTYNSIKERVARDLRASMEEQARMLEQRTLNQKSTKLLGSGTLQCKDKVPVITCGKMFGDHDRFSLHGGLDVLAWSEPKDPAAREFSVFLSY